MILIGTGLTNLHKRILSAIVLIAIAVVLTWIGGFAFGILACAIGVSILYEWQLITADRSTLVTRGIAWACLIIVLAVLLLSQHILLMIGILFAGAVLVAALGGREFGYWPAFGLIYAGFPSIALTLLRGDTGDGFAAILFLFAVVWATDIFAYFNGRALGGPKLAPRFSPNKTWAGALGGAAAGVAAGVTFAAFVAPAGGVPIPLIALLLSIIAQIGDLGESWVKRRFGVKDSSQLIPGHGGVMDRVDGLVAAAALLYVIGAILVTPEAPYDILF
ncbi:phosphatidate cytidylyltransferase [Phyllobacterium brassicacearum]|uniref:Phosphatidate cytidylyltransferase n=1 Tax=Phyllobacterium brassicacearum TaxID=314235 RepID=A0A2P7BS90_9HYPH|nr:phosphatidate cytidylyltransferase [Phyllobacterium brassicacearum]PSH69325.1 phosphatidate cytidylyltransferase [Phyllobacterium brassicacearum]TDQ34507.1 phosphatidate cytidylyltransferase [Phyllobacterium brassicacearum]